MGAVAAPVQHLEQNLDVVLVDGLGDRTVGLRLICGAERGVTVGEERARTVRREATCDDESDASRGTCGEEGSQGRHVVEGLLHAGVHGPHDEAIAQPVRTDDER